MRIKTIIIFIITLFVVSSAYSDDNIPQVPTGGDNGNETTLKNENPYRGTGRPKMPSKQIITCKYNVCQIYLSFVLPEGECTLMAQDSDGHYDCIAFDSSDLAVILSVSEMHGPIQVTLQTEHGNTYNGIIPNDE